MLSFLQPMLRRIKRHTIIYLFRQFRETYIKIFKELVLIIKKKILILLLALLSLSLQAEQLMGYNFPMKVKPYSALNFPPMMTKADFQKILETAANQIPYRKAYYLLGHIADLMHGHLIFAHQEGHTASPDFCQEEIDWDGLTPLAVLFHTQEFPDSYTPSVFETLSDQEIEKLNKLDRKKRNWIMWLKTTGLFRKKGSIQNARWHMKKGVTFNRRYTLYDEDINPKHFGKYSRVADDWTFHFFAVDCELIPERFKKDSNLIEIYHRAENKKICLALENLICMEPHSSHPEAYCPGVAVDQLSSLPPHITTADLENFPSLL